MMRPVPPEEAEPTELVAVGEADLARLRDRLAEIEAEHAMLEAELAVFEADYTREVVTVLAQLHDVEAQILERTGDRAAAREAHTRARRTTSAANAIAPAPDPVPPASLKRAFRDAAKRMHPDLAPTDEARGHAEAFMKRLNDAYRAGDAEAIADLVRQWESSPFAAGATGATRRPAQRRRAPGGGRPSAAPARRAARLRAGAHDGALDGRRRGRPGPRRDAARPRRARARRRPRAPRGAGLSVRPTRAAARPRGSSSRAPAGSTR